MNGEELSAEVITAGEKISFSTVTMSADGQVVLEKPGVLRVEAKLIEPGILSGSWIVRPGGWEARRGKLAAILRPDAVALARSIVKERDPLKRHEMMGRLLNQVTSENARDISAVFNGLPRDYALQQVKGLFAHAWGRLDGKAAVEHLAGTRAGSWTPREVGEALSGWAVSEPRAATAWLQSQTEGRSKAIYSYYLISGLIINDLDGAIRYVHSMKGELPDRSRHMERIVAQLLLMRDRKEVVDWASGLGDGELKTAALREIAEKFAGEDPGQAAKWLAGLLGSFDDKVGGALLIPGYLLKKTESMSADERAKWDLKHAERGFFPAESSRLINACEKHLPREKGMALDVAGGTGRHAIWLAEHGFEVTLTDISKAGLKIASEEAKGRGIDLETLCMDFEEDPFPSGPWDVILCCHYLHRPLFELFGKHLSSEGVLVFVHPTIRNLERQARPSVRFLLKEGELRRLACENGLESLHYQEAWSVADRHEALLVARRQT
jgi:protein-L-isoaspartate O-methyltransferase